ncbi:hypothetical protein A2634_00160 [Candidatus Amesbacteria bacterium RIFCSPHIGHO2_01_FULL_48_32]|uniref:Uncharacterized protein n=1 Tax=Candidatus Amesbacteria bacterium RIFCSPLOWO2_01_FULL_48_25 TaxID=1797259 RepID=A0A1F4ZAP8_9BACT|nr:MAG: hypothetical protein A2634_00160 [Candidatus Amesbacteria bacterium RIFCSPHIGHO2_01_FULL_48_32]OGD03221.1 MAG: hypothetical protein A2989_00110 [Candidatus Amesbacteria bacterium RIFCSPLOWO2_01_FULL_48_25]HJZ05165.1 hypothetical protein [Patescibacteria group bacterium]
MAWAKSSPPAGWAGVAALGMLAFYFATLTFLGGGWEFAWGQFSQYWWLVLPIVGTFGGQVYLAKNLKMAAGTGGVSGAAMIACCAHHVAEFLPFLGLFTAASFLIRYQIQFMFLALGVNVWGLIYLWLKHENHNKPFTL